MNHIHPEKVVYTGMQGCVPSKFDPDSDTITEDMINRRYGDRGHTFRSLRLAEAFAAKHPQAHITKLINYRDDQFKPVYGGMDDMKLVGYVLKPGATPYCKGYLVSLV